MKTITALLATAALSGCAFTPQTAQIAPNLVVAHESIGAGTTVSFRTSDERPTQSLGHRGSMYGANAEITSKEDIRATIHGNITEALKAKGFTVADYTETAPVKLSIELRSLEYSTSVGFWTGGVKVNAAIKAVGIRDGKPFEQMYRSDSEKRVIIVPGAKSNEAQITAALQEVLEQLFNDIGLMRHLAGK